MTWVCAVTFCARVVDDPDVVCDRCRDLGYDREGRRDDA